MIPVIKQLIEAGYINLDSSEKLDATCRDVSIDVYRDLKTGVIYLDPSYNPRNSEYYSNKQAKSTSYPRNEMDWHDVQRRSQIVRSLISGKKWLDFGCGPGYQLREDIKYCPEHLGVELGKSEREGLNSDGFRVVEDLVAANGFSPEVITLFHVFEHLPNPREILNQLGALCVSESKLVIEVPHARDFLISHVGTSFLSHTLWSEHIVLHTRESIRWLVEACGWEVNEIYGVQRYDVRNHMNWFKTGKPSGLNSALFSRPTVDLNLAYQNYLASIDMTDTLVLVATKANP